MLTWTGATSGSTQDASHDYNNLANWSGGVIDDSFDGVTFSSNTTLYFSADHTTGATGLNLNYSGNVDLTFASDSSTARTLTLGGDITGDFGGSSNARTVTIGSATAPLGIDAMGASRSYELAIGDQLTLLNPVVDGMLSAGTTADGWSSVEYDPNAIGGASFDGTTWTVSGASVDYDTPGDQGHFIYTPISGDMTAIVRVVSQSTPTGFDEGAWGTLMIQSSGDPNTPMQSIRSLQSSGIQSGNRLHADTWPGETYAGTTYWDPVWLKIVRRGSLFTTFWSADGSTWTQSADCHLPRRRWKRSADHRPMIRHPLPNP